MIDADSGAHFWAEQFDTPHADLLQMQDAIVTHLARALVLQLTEAEAARLKRTPSANPNAEDLALQCTAALRKGGYIGAEADAGYRLCEQALAVDPNNIRALAFLSVKFWLPVALGLSADPQSDLARADELASKALALDANNSNPHNANGHGAYSKVLAVQRRFEEAIAESERALGLDPADADSYAGLSSNYLALGQLEKSFELYDKTIRLSPLDPALFLWYSGKSWA